MALERFSVRLPPRTMVLTLALIESVVACLLEDLPTLHVIDPENPEKILLPRILEIKQTTWVRMVHSPV